MGSSENGELCLATKLFTSSRLGLCHRIRRESGALICRDCLCGAGRYAEVETSTAFTVLAGAVHRKKAENDGKTSAGIHLGLLVSLGLWNHSISLESEATPTLTM